MSLEGLTDKQLMDIIRKGPNPSEIEQLETTMVIKIQGLRAEMELGLRSLAEALGFKRSKKGDWKKKRTK